MKKRKKASTKSPIRVALIQDSSLQALVKDGLAAMKSSHRSYIDNSVRTSFADSIDLDEAMKAEHAGENRWDYLLGHMPSKRVVGLEPHSAKHDEISTVIAKRRSARDQLQTHLRPGAQIASWLWVASGKVRFADTGEGPTSTRPEWDSVRGREGSWQAFARRYVVGETTEGW